MKRGTAKNRLLDYYVGIPVLNLAATFRSYRRMPSAPRRIGIFLNPALGDTLLGSGPVQDVRGIYPSASLILFAARSNLAAASLLPSLNSVELLPITRPAESIRVFRTAQLDLLLDLTSWQRITAFYSLMSGSKYTVGFAREGQHRARGYDMTVEHRGDCHELDNMRRLTGALGASEYHAPRLVIPEGPNPRPPVPAERLVVFHAWATGTLHGFREWPANRWVNLAERLCTVDRTFVLTGSPADEQRCIALQSMMLERGLRTEILIGRDGIAGVARFLRHAEVLVTVNTGIMHLAAIQGVPTVALNGPNSAHRWGPIGPHVFNVQTRDGSGGFLDLGFEFKGRDVMDQIPVESVLDAISAVRSSYSR